MIFETFLLTPLKLISVFVPIKRWVPDEQTWWVFPRCVHPVHSTQVQHCLSDRPQGWGKYPLHPPSHVLQQYYLLFNFIIFFFEKKWVLWLYSFFGLFSIIQLPNAHKGRRICLFSSGFYMYFILKFSILSSDLAATGISQRSLG